MHQRRTLRTLLAVTLLLPPAAASAAVETREVGNMVLEDVPEIPARLGERLNRYQNTRSASLRDWLPGGGILIATRFGETTQLHVVDRPGAMRRQITFFAEPVGGGWVSPEADRSTVLFSKDVGGSEFFQIFGYGLRDGETRMLTDGVSRNGGVRWSRRGDRFAFYSTRRNGRDWDIFIDRLDGEPAVPVLEQGGAWGVADWAPDDGRLLVRRYISANESRYAILDLQTGDLTPVNPTEEKISYGFAAVWSHDGKGIFMTSDEGSEFRQLRHYHVATGEFSHLTPDIAWDVGQIDLSPDGRVLAFTVNEGGITHLYLMDTATRQYHPVPGLPEGRIGSLRFSPDGAHLGLVISTPQTPGDVYALELDDESLVRWTFSEVGGLDADSFASPELIHFPTFDTPGGRPRLIPAFYYRPPGDGPFPVVVLIHGGPEGQYGVSFSSSIAYYVHELGVAVLAPNVRGSAGYGKSYLKLDNGMKREDSIRDIGKLLDWIARQKELDAKRVAVIGGSYGGYMVLGSMTHFNDRLRCGVDTVGISNFVTFLENTKEYRRDLRRIEYGDERDPEMRAFLDRISPTTNAHRITRPMLIAQGLNDPRVPAGEAEQIVEAIRKNDSDVWYLLARDEGHGFRKKRNRDLYTQVVALFLEKHLLGGDDPTGRAAKRATRD